MPNIKDQSPLEPQLKISKLSLIPDHQTYGSHHTLVNPLPVGYTRPMIHQNHPHIKLTVKPLTLPMDLDQLSVHYALMMLTLVMSLFLMPLSLKLQL